MIAMNSEYKIKVFKIQMLINPLSWTIPLTNIVNLKTQVN
jgi:hypothetical protein